MRRFTFRDWRKYTQVGNTSCCARAVFSSSYLMLLGFIERGCLIPGVVIYSIGGLLYLRSTRSGWWRCSGAGATRWTSRRALSWRPSSASRCAAARPHACKRDERWPQSHYFGVRGTPPSTAAPCLACIAANLVSKPKLACAHRARTGSAHMDPTLAAPTGSQNWQPTPSPLCSTRRSATLAARLAIHKH